MTSNYVYVMAVEKLADVTPPPRAEYIRVIMTELNRIASHLLWYGTFCLEIGATTPFLYSFRDREKVLDLFESACGARLLYNYVRIGGVGGDISNAWLDRVIEFLDYWEPMIPEYEQLLDENPIFYNRTQGVGIVSLDMLRSYGVSGPNIRAAGLAEDVRRDDPFSVYADLEFEIPVEQESDVFARYRVRMRELRESAKIVRQAREKIPTGPVHLPHNYRFKVPAGEGYVHIESPRGDIGCYLVSEGGDKPWRCKFRTPSFVHIQLFKKLLEGVLIPDIMAICASFDIVLPETDR
jgi:NADH-quinone oxidoreductase subunit D